MQSKLSNHAFTLHDYISILKPRRIFCYTLLCLYLAVTYFNLHFSGPPVKRRKRHSRKPRENQEQCVMRGVYFKNMKWQAAIKVDKKQIHLGTVASQEEAARLYDR